MQKKHQKDSFEIGDEFEHFVENTIFTKDKYALIHRTSSKNENDARYPESASKPDFQFRCLETGQEFYVEAKYRSSAIDNKVKGLKLNQEIRFKKINQETPVFVIIGYWGKPSNPIKLSILKLEDCKYRYLFTYYLNNFEIEKVTLPNNYLKLGNKKTSQDNKTPDTKTSKSTNTLREKFKVNPKVFGLAAVGVIAIILSIFSFAFSNKNEVIKPREKLLEIVSDYYQSMNSNQIEKLPEFLSSNVESWYGSKGMSNSQILNDAKNHRGTYPYSTTKIDWNTFKVMQQSDGDFMAVYDMVYKRKKNIHDDYKVFNLHLITTWDENFKLKSIREN